MDTTDNQPLDQVQSETPAAEAPAGPSKAVIIVGTGKLPTGKATKIVVEGRTFERNEAGDVTAVTVVKKGYASGADLYVRYDPTTAFPDGGEVATIGDNVRQHQLWGFTAHEGFVNVGPAHPAFAAANLAFQRGATDIEITGLSDAEKELLRPYFDDLPTNAVEPAQVTVRFT